MAAVRRRVADGVATDGPSVEARPLAPGSVAGHRVVRPRTDVGEDLGVEVADMQWRAPIEDRASDQFVEYRVRQLVGPVRVVEQQHDRLLARFVDHLAHPGDQLPAQLARIAIVEGRVVDAAFIEVAPHDRCERRRLGPRPARAVERASAVASRPI